MKKVLLVLFLVSFALCGCQTAPTKPGTPATTDQLVLGVEKALEVEAWIHPLADVVAMGVCTATTSPSIQKGCAIYNTVSVGVDGLVVLTKELLKKYKADPTPTNREELIKAFVQLKDAINKLDDAYKGKM